MGDLVKAMLIPKEGEHKDQQIKVLFNPKELTITKQNTWNAARSPSENAPAYEFGSGGPSSLKLQLFFDTYSLRKDVRSEHTDQIYALMKVDAQLGSRERHRKSRPPLVQFQWGSFTFLGVITSFSQRFTLFLENGSPVRAVLDITLQQAKDEAKLPGQNPTSGGAGGERMWQVRKGDTLQTIANNEYGDPTQWRMIAQANNLSRVRQLTPGQTLIVPSL